MGRSSSAAVKEVFHGHAHSREEQLREMTERFYDGLNSLYKGDTEPMFAIWSHSDQVSQMGPFGGIKVGWDAVSAEFKETSAKTSSGDVWSDGLQIQVLGNLGYTTCMERGYNVDRSGQIVTVSHRATSIYHHEGGEWKLVHHHTDISPSLVQNLGELDAT